MRYFEFHAETPYYGADETELCTYPDDVTEEQLNDDCETWGRNHCEGYEYLATGWDEEWEDEEERDSVVEDYWNGCGWGWNELTLDEYLEKREEEFGLGG